MSLNNKVQALAAEHLNLNIVELDFSNIEFELELEQTGHGYYSESKITASIGGFVTHKVTGKDHCLYIPDLYGKLHKEIEEALHAAVRIN
jgi:hypothetical protein